MGWLAEYLRRIQPPVRERTADEEERLQEKWRAFAAHKAAVHRARRPGPDGPTEAAERKSP